MKEKKISLLLSYSLQNVTPFEAQTLNMINVFYLLRFVPMQISKVFWFFQHLLPPLRFKESRWLSYHSRCIDYT